MKCPSMIANSSCCLTLSVFLILIQHGGSTNAFTSNEHTNYFFDVNIDGFEEALDRWMPLL